MTDFRKLRKWHSYNVLSCSNSTGSLEKWYKLSLIVVSVGSEQQVSFACDRILDIVEQPIDIKGAPTQAGISFCAVIQGQVTEIIDVDEVITNNISTAMLKRASSGCYKQHEVVRGLPTPLLHKYFQHCGKEWQVKEDLRKAIEFRQINLTEPFGSMPQMDIIFLRNVLIYFDVQTKQSILARVGRVLRPKSYLFLGGGETTVNLDPDFELVQFEKGICDRLRSGSLY